MFCLSQEINNEGTTKVQLKQQIISCKEQLDDKREPKTTDAKQNEPSAKSVDTPGSPFVEEPNDPSPTKSVDPPEDHESTTEPNDPSATKSVDPPEDHESTTEPINVPAASTDCVNNQGDSDTSKTSITNYV